jgi:ubiquinone/menaquinone biosynthesis C-methylase UbiE
MKEGIFKESGPMISDKSDSKGFLKRFDGRADAYSKFRPRYPIEVLQVLEKEISFNQGRIVADVGSGTGILSELFLENGNAVYCVEPNEGMRRAAEKSLDRFTPLFISVEGTAEMTNLKDASIDLIVVGQALHWFDIEKTRQEFRRILAGEGHVAIIYNLRKEESEAEKAYEALIQKFGKDRGVIPEVDDDYIKKFFMNSEFRKSVIPNSQTLGREGMLGRLASTSYMPSQGSQVWADVEVEVKRILDRFGCSGQVVLHYDTTMYLGRISF